MTLRELLSVYNGRQFRICILEEEKWVFYDAFCLEEAKRRKELERYKNYKVYKFEVEASNSLEGYISITI